MTVLNFVTQEKSVYIVTDSSFSDHEDILPAGFITKAYFLPHLEGIIAGTGLAKLAADWFIRVNTGFVIRDMVQLDRFTQRELQTIFAGYRDQGAPEGSSTIYHWGYDREAKKMVCYAYKSINNFQSQELGVGSMLKPGIQLGDFQVQEFPADYLTVMERQKAEDEARPLSERAGVAGHLIAYQMHAIEDHTGATRVTMMAERYAALSDFEAGYQVAVNRLNKR